MKSVLNEYITSSICRISNDKAIYRLLSDNKGLWIETEYLYSYENKLCCVSMCRLTSTLQSIEDIDSLITMLEKAKKFIQAEEKL